MVVFTQGAPHYFTFLLEIPLKHEGKRTLGKPKRRGEDNIKMDLRKRDGGAWIELIWLRTGTVGGLLSTR